MPRTSHCLNYGFCKRAVTSPGSCFCDYCSAFYQIQESGWSSIRVFCQKCGEKTKRFAKFAECDCVHCAKCAKKAIMNDTYSENCELCEVVDTDWVLAK